MFPYYVSRRASLGDIRLSNAAKIPTIRLPKSCPDCGERVISELVEWIGPFESGESITTSHIWESEDSYSIQVKSRDIYGSESEWSDPLTVTMPRTKIFNQLPRILGWLFERFPFLEFLI